MNTAARGTGPVIASVPDTLRAVAGVLLPLVARGVIVRRQRVVAMAERVDADGRLVRALQRLRDRYGPGPLALRIPLRRIVLVLADDDVRRVLAASPDPFATATREKRAALGRFEPHGVLISDAADRPDRRRWNEAVLDTARPLHHLAEPMAAVVREEARTLLNEVAAAGGRLDWPAFTAAWFRIARRVTLGVAARDDTALTELLNRLRALGNWAMFAPRPGPAVCAGQNLVLFLTSTFLAALLDGHDVGAHDLPLRPGRPLPGTLDPFRLRFTLTPRRHRAGVFRESVRSAVRM